MRSYYVLLAGISAILIVVGGVIVIWQSTKENDIWLQSVEQCHSANQGLSERINCWMEEIEEVYIASGTREAFEVFEYLYEHYPEFTNSGCHRQAHRVGDIAYYRGYLSHFDLTRIDFPKSANACGYGFYHGFIEHLIQDNPSEEFVKQTCEYLIERLESIAPAIGQTCYHGSGHGFLIARADEILSREPIDIKNVTTWPIEQCDRLGVEFGYTRECKEGVFNVFVDWMVEDNYGLSYDYERPFSVCEPLLPDGETYKVCSIEISRKFDSLSGYSPREVLRLVKENPFSEIHHRMFQIAVSGIVQHNPKNALTTLTEECRGIEIPFDETCFAAIFSGMLEHGDPSGVYQQVNLFCEDVILNSEERQLCYQTSNRQLERFYTKDEVEQLCQDNSLSSGFCEFFKANQERW